MNVINLFRGPAQAKQFEQLVRPHMTRLYQAAYRLTASPEGAEDLVQDLLVKLYPRTAELAEIDSLWPWLKKALYREFVDDLRKRQRRPEPSADDADDPDAMPGTTATPEQQLERGQQAEWLQQALAQLEPEHRALVIMHLVEGYSVQELSELFGMPVETIRTRLRRSRARLKKILAI